VWQTVGVVWPVFQNLGGHKNSDRYESNGFFGETRSKPPTFKKLEPTSFTSFQRKPLFGTLDVAKCGNEPNMPEIPTPHAHTCAHGPQQA
jgi:hypothetical protein